MPSSAVYSAFVLPEPLPFSHTVLIRAGFWGAVSIFTRGLRIGIITVPLCRKNLFGMLHEHTQNAGFNFGQLGFLLVYPDLIYKFKAISASSTAKMDVIFANLPSPLSPFIHSEKPPVD
ncbi:hypothetical protein [Acutalibacter sp. 1XD8-33]|uniref:hypothetical protein n=1 Tax=Acutalibacter sp. 1XD8-33 TaxID=2320081 RepID=UPI0011C3523C|nr:hypothetical protein [Acutalibacter sp. 1XD8-33]